MNSTGSTIQYKGHTYVVLTTPILLQVDGEVRRQCVSVPLGDVYLVGIRNSDTGLIALLSPSKLPRRGKNGKREQTFCVLNVQHLSALEEEQLEELSQIASLQASVTALVQGSPRNQRATDQDAAVQSLGPVA